nr:RNA polymerase sigma factor [Luteibacter rhizovicinus]
MLTPKTDSELISRFLAGDQRAFADLVRRYQSPLRQFLRRLSAGDHALADDIAQETFLKMFTSLVSFRGEAGISTWLHTIAYRTFLRHVANRSRLEFVGHDSMPEAISPAPTVMSDILVEQLMKHLSLDERLMVTLSVSGGMSHAEIAEVTQAPLGTIKSHINRAKKKLARLLGSEEECI